MIGHVLDGDLFTQTIIIIIFFLYLAFNQIFQMNLILEKWATFCCSSYENKGLSLALEEVKIFIKRKQNLLLRNSYIS